MTANVMARNMTEAQFLQIDWPEEFEIELLDGTRERLLKARGVSFTGTADDPEERGFIAATLPRGDSNVPSDCDRLHYTDEIVRIMSLGGYIIWPQESSG